MSFRNELSSLAKVSLYSVPEDGRNYRPKHVELIEITNKLLLLHLVGCLCYYTRIALKCPVGYEGNWMSIMHGHEERMSWPILIYSQY